MTGEGNLREIVAQMREDEAVAEMRDLGADDLSAVRALSPH